MTNNNKKKVMRKFRPFRVKKSTIVTMRYKPPPLKSKASSTKFVELWLDPVPGRDMNYNLIGKLIRCVFPKDYHADLDPKERILEGEVVSTKHFHCCHSALGKQRSDYINVNDDERLNSFQVKLLIDKEYLSKMPFLKEENDYEDLGSNGIKLTQSERQRRVYEGKIRGNGKVLIALKLAEIIPFSSTFSMSKSVITTAQQNMKSKKETPKTIKWVIRKWVPIKTAGKKKCQQSQHFIGDEYDADSQKEKNFRWLSTVHQFEDQDYYHHNHYKMGEVIHVQVNDDSLSNINSKSGSKNLIQDRKGMISSLATVTVKRMMLPELTHSGRLAHHGWDEIFDLHDSNEDSIFQVPIEDVIGISCRVHRIKNVNDLRNMTLNSDDLFMRYRYNHRDVTYQNLLNNENGIESENNYSYEKYHQIEETSAFKLSFKWENSLKRTLIAQKEMNRSIKENNNSRSNKVERTSKCVPCSQDQIIKDKQINRNGEFENKELINDASNTSLLALTRSLLDSASTRDFDLPFDFLERFSSQRNFQRKNVEPPSKRQKKESIKKKHSQPSPKRLSKKTRTNTKVEANVSRSQILQENDDEHKKFKPTSARCICYDTINRNGVRQTNSSAAHAAQTVASIRSGGRKSYRSLKSSDEQYQKNTSSRAARANQRHRNKVIERSGLEQSKKMVGREEVLRFGKSLIHGWGVFTDGNINAGDLIVEYRGVLIGNTVADKREKEYEKAKIGSDYMFRIDSETVCDATHHGNVARFINASCTPNCYTQIITLNGSKRIAIYAKRDIFPGEELSYDYKFEPEFVESKRIPCNCGTIDCRGFMNWNKKYVAIKNTNQPL